MGIQGFQKFQTGEVPGGASKVKMIDQIKIWKEENPGKDPIIIVRLAEVVISIVQLDLIAAGFGGRHQICRKKLDALFKALLEAGAKLLFCGNAAVRGYSSQESINKLCSTKDQDYQRFMKVLNTVDVTKKIKPGSRGEIRTMLGLCEKQIAEQYGEYHMCAKDINTEMLRLALSRENVLAILAKDSDFLLYNLGAVQYWSSGVEHLNFRDLETIWFDQRAMRKYVKLSPYQFHLLVAVLSTIYIEDNKKAQITQTIFRKKTQKPCSASIKLIYNISEAVKDNVPFQADATDFEAVSKMIFEKHWAQNVEHLKMQYKKYDVDQEDDSADGGDAGQQDFRENNWVYAIWNDYITTIPNHFVDLRAWNMENSKTFSELAKFTYKRIFGVVLQCKHDPDLKRKMCVTPSHRNRTMVIEVKPVYPEFDVPELQKLILENIDGDEEDEELTQMKWKILFWILNIPSDDELLNKIKSVSDDIIPILVTVLFLIRENQITPMEADVIIMSERDIINGLLNEDIIEYPVEVNGREIRVAHIYVLTRVLVNNCFNICGIGLFKKPVQFDGVHFHKLMDKYSKDFTLLENEENNNKIRVIDF